VFASFSGQQMAAIAFARLTSGVFFARNLKVEYARPSQEDLQQALANGLGKPAIPSQTAPLHSYDKGGRLQDAGIDLVAPQFGYWTLQYFSIFQS